MFFKGKRPLVTGALALTASGIVARLLGTLYRIFLVRMAGEEVLGLLQMTMSLYHLAIGVATMGLSVAITQLVADAIGRRRQQDALVYMQTAFVIVVSASLAIAGLFWLSAPAIAQRFFADPRLEHAISSLGFLLIPAAICGVLRGIVQGWGGLPYIAVAGLLEVVLRVPGVLILLRFMLPFGIEVAVAAIIVGMVVGEAGSLVFLGAKVHSLVQGARSIRRKSRPERWRWRTAKQLLSLGVPVAASNLLNSAMGLINAAMVPRQLIIAGLTQSQATQAFGQISGMVLPMLYMPMVLIGPVTQVVIPAVAERMAQKRRDAVGALLRKAFAIAGGVAVVSAIAFWFFPELLGKILYNAPHIAPLIRPLAIAAPFAFLGSVAGGTLYGLGHTGAVMVHVFAGNVTRFLLIWLLVSDPAWGVFGAIWALVADHAVTSLLHLAGMVWYLRRASSTR